MEGGIEVAVAALEAEDGCVPGGTVVRGEVGSVGVPRHFRMGLIRRLVGDTVIFYFMPAQTKGTAYSVVGGGVLCWWRRTLLVVEAEVKRGVGEKFGEV